MNLKFPFYIIIVQLFFLISALSFSCEKEAPRLSKEQKALIDTLVKERTILLRAELDSLCNVDFDKKVQIATDSMVKIRIEEINQQFR